MREDAAVYAAPRLHSMASSKIQAHASCVPIDWPEISGQGGQEEGRLHGLVVEAWRYLAVVP